jgi:hypothetical protein
MKGWKMLALALIVSACATTRGGTQVRAGLDEEFRLRTGQTALVGDDGLRVGFVRVTEDQRCPINARCIRAGFARVEVQLSAPRTAAQRAILSTPDEPKGASYGAYEVQVLDVQPGREIGKPVPRYEAVLRVRRR